MGRLLPKRRDWVESGRYPLPLPLDGGGWVGVALGQGFGDREMHPVRIAEHVRIPEAQHAIALRLDQPRPRSVEPTGGLYFMRRALRRTPPLPNPPHKEEGAI